MTTGTSVSPAERQRIDIPVVAFLGNPNTGKTTLFNALTGMRQRVGNYPGVTVERKAGRMAMAEGPDVELLDLPGLYSLSANSPDEMIAVDVLLGQLEGERCVRAVVCVADASNLQRSLFLVSQVMDIGLPVIVALNMGDVAASRGVLINVTGLEERIGVPFILTRANRGEGVGQLKEAIAEVLQDPGPALPNADRLPQFPGELGNQVDRLLEALPDLPEGESSTRLEITRGILDVGGKFEERLADRRGPGTREMIEEARRGLVASLEISEGDLAGLESRIRHEWARSVMQHTVERPEALVRTPSDRIDRWLTHRLFGSLLFVLVMTVVFQALYAWASPLISGIEAIFSSIGVVVSASLPPGAFRSLLVDGVIAGAGGVLVFVPQVGILFMFLSVLEDCGYMARAAFLVDRILAKCGLSGKSFMPLMSSFACAVPGIMATRTIEDRRTRMVTILVAPLMSCSARLPVYVIMISAFVPDEHYLGGIVGLQGITLLAMYFVGTAVALPTAWLMNRFLFRRDAAPFIMELPSYKLPDARTVGLRVYLSCKSFVTRAGSIILAAAIVLWALAYYPRWEPEEASLRYSMSSEQLASRQLEFSFIGKAGHYIEPAVKPLGWDWRIGVAAIASFPAREVVIATLGTLFSLGDGVDEASEDLRQALGRATWPDGRLLFTMGTALSLMVFFALCAQCLATLAVIKRETGSWRWPLVAFAYMTTLAYVGALIVYQTTTVLSAVIQT